MDFENLGRGVKDESFRGERMIEDGRCCSHGSFMHVRRYSRSELLEDEGGNHALLI